MSQAFLDAVAANKDNKNKLGNKPKPPKYPNVNDVDLGIDGTKPQGGKPGKEQTSLADDKEEDEEGEDVDGEEEEDPDDGEEADDGDEEDDEDDEEEDDDDLAF